MGRLTMARPLIESGRLVALTGNRILDRYAHYLVYPPRSENHPAVIAFRTWILGVAGSESPVPRSEPPDTGGPRPLARRRGRRR
jgi:LysR family glycine cleavage system transcriptional activator